MDKRFVGILVALILVFGGIFLFSRNSSDNNNSNSQPTSHVTGSPNSKVTLLEYGDYQCSVCQAYEPTVQRVIETFKKTIKFQFRNLPLTPIHPNAFAAARTAEAAGAQNKYWQMHDLLYQPVNWKNWTEASNPTPLFESYAQQLKLDLNKFRQDFKSDQVNAAIKADIAEFNKTGRQQATPTFFINGQVIENSSLSDPTTGSPSLQKFSAIIKAELAKQR